MNRRWESFFPEGNQLHDKNLKTLSAWRTLETLAEIQAKEGKVLGFFHNKFSQLSCTDLPSMSGHYLPLQVGLNIYVDMLIFHS